MTAEVERRIVEMQFENEQFEKGARQSLSTLEKLDDFLDNMSASGMDKISSALDELTYRFSAFGIAGAEAVRKVTDRVIGLAANMLRAIPEQIISGGINRATNIEQAQFQLKGLGVAWENIKDDIDYAVKDTAYGMDEAATAASILAAANINWKNNVDGASDMAHALRSISGIAAMTNSSYSDIASVLTDVAAAGRVTGDVITRLAYRGLNVTAVLAKTMGKSQEEVMKMMDEGKLSVQEFYKVMDQAFGEHATKANDTYVGSLMNIGAALSRIGADFVSVYHGDVENADSETERVEHGMIRINNALRNMYNRMHDVTKSFAEGWFKNNFYHFAEKIAGILDKIKFTGLKKILDLISRLDLSFIDRLIDKIGNVIGRIRDFFAETKDPENPMDAFKEWDNFDKGHRLQKLKNFFKGMKETFWLISGILKQVWGTLNRITGGLLGKFVDKLLNAGDAFGKFMGDAENIDRIYRKVKEFLAKVEEFGLRVRRIVGLSVQIVWESLKKIWNFLKDIGVFRTLGDILGWIGEKIFGASGSLEEFLENLLKVVKEGSFLDVLGTIFGGFGEALGNIWKKVKEFFGYFKLGIDFGKLKEKFGSVGEFIGGVFTRIKEAIATVFGSKDGSGNKVANAASTILAAFLSFRKLERVKWFFERIGRFFSMITGKKGWLEPLSDVPNKIQTILARISGAIRAFTDNMNVKSMKEVALAVLILTGALVVLSLIPEEKLETSMGHLVTLMIVLAGVFVLLSDALIGAGWTMSMMGATILAFGAALLLMAGALWIISKIDPERMKESFDAMGLMMLSMMVAIGALAMLNPGKVLAAGGAFLMLSAGLLAISVALAVLSLFNAEKVHAAWEMLTWMLISMAAAIGILSLLNPAKMLAGAASLLILSGAVLMISVSMAILSQFNAEKVHAAWEMLTWMLISMTAALGILALLNPVKLLAGAAALAILSAAVLVISVSLAVLSVFNAEKVRAAWDTLTWMLLSMTAALGIVTLLNPIKMIAGALALIMVSAALMIIADSLAILSVFNSEGVRSAFESLTWMLLGMTAALGIMNLMNPLKAIGSAAALLILSFSLVRVAFAIAVLSGLDADGMQSAVEGLFWVLLSIAAVIGVLSLLNPLKAIVAAAALVVAMSSIAVMAAGLQKIAEAINTNSDVIYGVERLIIVLGLALAGLAAIGGKMIIGALALVIASASLLIAGPGIKAIGEALPYLANGIKAFSGIDLKTLLMSMGSMVTVLLGLLGLPFATFGTVGVEVLTAFGAALPILAAGIAAFGQVSGWDLVKLLGGVATGIGSILAIRLARNGVNDFYTVAVGLEKIADAVVKIPENIGQILKDFAKGLEGGIPEIRYALNDLSEFMIGKFSNETMRRNWITIGHNIVVGIANGITNNSYIATNALTRLANSLQRSFTVSLAIRSPSRVFEHLAEYIPQGIAIGIQNGQSEVTDAMVSSMSGAVSYMEQLGKNSSDYAPSVRPVMDLGGMRSSMLYADQMLRGSSLGSMGNISGLNVSGDNISYSMRNKDVVSELQILESEISRLGQAIENLQLVMDTGLVVGALAPQMNSQLGVMAVREGRQ